MVQSNKNVKRSAVRVLQILKLLEAYIIINFKTYKISLGAHKLTEHPR